jgi:hypothetical protein
MGERRQHLRQHLSSVAYVSLGDAGGGILLDISDSGFGAQVIGQFAPHQLMHVSLDLTGTPYRLECGGRIAWTNPDGQLGFEFLGISEAARMQLRHWLSLVGENAARTAPAAAPVLPALKPQSPPATKARATPASPSPPPAKARAAHAVSPVTRRAAVRPRAPALPAALQGPYFLTVEDLEQASPSGLGVYVLGDRLPSGNLEVLRVGRSPDLKQSLAEYIGRYQCFQYVVALSEVDAWDRECQLYHQHRPRHNPVHPVRRDDWDCPVCHGFS